MPKYERLNHVSLHVLDKSGESVHVELSGTRDVADLLVGALTRALGAYGGEIRARVEAAAQVQRIMDELGVTAFIGGLAKVFGPHPSKVETNDATTVDPDADVSAFPGLVDDGDSLFGTPGDKPCEPVGGDAVTVDPDLPATDVDVPVVVAGVDGDVVVVGHESYEPVPGQPGTYQRVFTLPADDEAELTDEEQAEAHDVAWHGERPADDDAVE